MNRFTILKRWTVPDLKFFHEGRQLTVWLVSPLVGVATGLAAILFRLATTCPTHRAEDRF
ncbi:MAG: hypothetical protein AB7G54_08535 [Methyloceanibacter sp.]